MPGTTEATGPAYISSHSADVILSDIRPIKLKLEALRSINVLLDEFLFNILNTARSLSTDKLRASLLSILPTSLGKEALLEAEVELRAYWDRTARPDIPEDDTQTFHLQWAFELLRLKCEAYSTLNESDEDSAALGQLQERMKQIGGTTPPLPGLVAPASLYLTAILESMCEHILSNVGRVAARDSSRTGATVQDVFVALCEDHSIYALFKSMRVYQQIELLSQAPKPRRSKSFSRSDRPSISRPSPSNQDLPSSGRDPSQHRSRGSTDTSATLVTSTTGTMPVLATSTSRSSFDKGRMKKLMSGSRNSSEREGDSQNSHKRSESVLSEDTKQTLAAYNQNDAQPEDTAMLQEFDNLMRSDSTMKVSLTPDRLKTMEVYKQEKDRGHRRPAPLAFGKTDTDSPSSSTPPSRANGRRPSLRHVDSIVEDEEEMPSASAPTPRKNNIKSSPNLPSTSTTSISSTSNSSASRVVPRKSSRSNLTSSPSETTPPLPMSYPKRGPSGPAGLDTDPFPVKTRRIQKNRESLDLDAVMAGSDDEDDEPAPPPRTPSKTVATPKRNPAPPRQPSSPHAVSASTRDLMNFLNEGPPDVPKVSAAGRDMMDFLAQGPPDHGVISNNGVSTIENGKKGSGRLQRMMSKLAMGTSERSRQTSEDFGRGNKMAPPTTPVRVNMGPGPGQGVPRQTSYGNLSSLANRPVPPRPPPVQPISPPASPSDEEYSSSTRSRKASATHPATPRRVMPTWEQQMADGQALPNVPVKPETVENGNANGTSVNGNGNGYSSRSVNGHVKSGAADEPPPRSPSARRPSAGTSAAPALEVSKRGPPKPVQTQTVPPPSRKAAPAAATAPVAVATPLIAEDHARDMRRLLARATNADECRLLFDMFLVKSGVALEHAPYDAPYPSPLSDNAHSSTRESSEVMLELALVELFLGGGEEQAPPPRPQRRVKKQPEAAAPTAAPASADIPAEPHKYATVMPFEAPLASARAVSEVGA
ncbi:hypothetical protein B0H11DRAFT_1794394 [Mycena galericulata]|nr:hypothetical protein B0H11DRAFT_1794394 [Mycena galericulata]